MKIINMSGNPVKVMENAGKIRIVHSCSCNCEHLEEGQVLDVPADITLANAKQLVVMKRAVIVPPRGAEDPKPGPEPAEDDSKTDKNKKLGKK